MNNININIFTDLGRLTSMIFKKKNKYYNMFRQTLIIDQESKYLEQLTHILKIIYI